MIVAHQSARRNMVTAWKLAIRQESNDRDSNRAANDPHYGGRGVYDSGRSQDYFDGVEQGRSDVRNSTK